MWVYVSINAGVKRAIIQFPLTQKVFLYLSLSLSVESTAHSGIHQFGNFTDYKKKKETEKASIYTFRPIRFNDCHFNHNEPSVSGVCPFIIAPIQCRFAPDGEAKAHDQ